MGTKTVSYGFDFFDNVFGFFKVDELFGAEFEAEVAFFFAGVDGDYSQAA